MIVNYFFKGPHMILVNITPGPYYFNKGVWIAYTISHINVVMLSDEAQN